MRKFLVSLLSLLFIFNANNFLYSQVNEEDFLKAEKYVTHKIIEQDDHYFILDDGSVWGATDFMDSTQTIKHFTAGKEVIAYYKDFSNIAARIDPNNKGPVEDGMSMNFRLKGSSHLVNVMPVSFPGNVLHITKIEITESPTEFTITLSDGSVWERCFSNAFFEGGSVPLPGDHVLFAYIGHPFPTPGNFNIIVLSKAINDEFVSIHTKLLWVD